MNKIIIESVFSIMLKNDTIDYYNNNAQDFYLNTAEVDFSKCQNIFINYLTPGSLILDLGCGSGRDSKFFLKKGFKVEATDGSKEMCKLASKNTGLSVRHMLFNDLKAKDLYDGVWACASLLHVPYKKLPVILQKVYTALKDQGVAYLSFKYGDFEGMRNERYFTDMTEERFIKLLENLPDFKLIKSWVSSDARDERKNEHWLNIILQKNKSGRTL